MLDKLPKSLDGVVDRFIFTQTQPDHKLLLLDPIRLVDTVQVAGRSRLGHRFELKPKWGQTHNSPQETGEHNTSRVKCKLRWPGAKSQYYNKENFSETAFQHPTGMPIRRSERSCALASIQILFAWPSHGRNQDQNRIKRRRHGESKKMMPKDNMTVQPIEISHGMKLPSGPQISADVSLGFLDLR